MKKHGDRGAPDRVLTYFKAEKYPLFLVTVTGLLYNVGLVAGPYFEGQLAQTLRLVLDGSSSATAMWRVAALYVAVTVFVQALRAVKRFYVRRFANNVGRRMKRILYRSLLRRSLQGDVGSVMTRAVSDADACAEGMRKVTTEVFDTGVALCAYLGMLFVYDPRLTLLCLPFPPLAYFAAEKMKGKVTKSVAACRESAGRLNGATLDRVSGAVTYRILGAEGAVDAGYERCLADYERKTVRAALLESALPPLYRMITLLPIVLIVAIGIRDVSGSGFASWDIAAFTAYLACYVRLAVKSAKAAKLFNAVQRAAVSWRRISPYLRAVPDETPAIIAAPAAVTVSALSVAFGAGENVLSGITVAAQPGMIVGVTGPVACGKSVFGLTFTGEVPYTGNICFGNRELSSLRDEERAGIVGYMGHEPELLDDTIAENIRLGAPITDREILTALQAVCLDREVAAMPEGIHTVVGSGGVRLSGGQQARLALARVLCHPRPLTVLDDPFAAVDRDTEERILRHLRGGAGVTLLISHRVYLFPSLDAVLYIDRDGHAVSGSHAELYETVPVYRQAFDLQGGGERK